MTTFYIYCVLILTALLSISVCVFMLIKYKKQSDKIADVEKKMDVLIRITAQHDLFIDNLKQKHDELMNLKRRIR